MIPPPITRYPLEIPLADIPPHITADDVYIKIIPVAKAGTLLDQHVHKYDHTTMLCTGAVRVWENGEHKGDYRAPYPFLVKAGVFHQFQTLKDDTLILCIHNAMRPDVAAIIDGDE